MCLLFVSYDCDIWPFTWILHHLMPYLTQSWHSLFRGVGSNLSLVQQRRTSVVGPAADPGFKEGRFVPSPPLSSSPLPSHSPSLPLPLPFRPPPLPSTPFPFLSLPRLYPFSPSPPLRSRTPWLRLGGLGNAITISSPSRSGRSQAAKRFLVHFQPIWAHFGKHFQATCP